jgi:hypothetical protein
MIDDCLTIGNVLNVCIHGARIVGLLHIQPGRPWDVLVGDEIVALRPCWRCNRRYEKTRQSASTGEGCKHCSNPPAANAVKLLAAARALQPTVPNVAVFNGRSGCPKLNRAKAGCFALVRRATAYH